jgi:RimJ/RimL family protein N-acetyltransferase
MKVEGIRGDRIRLVPLDKALHLENYVRWFNDPEVNHWLKLFLPLMRAQEERWFDRFARSKDDVVWAVHDEDGRHIGATGIHRIDWRNRNGVTGTVIGEKTAWGRGYGTDVMRTRTRWAFEELGLHRLQSDTFAENLASARCLQKVGYREVGVMHRRVWRHGAWHDLRMWEILAEDWFATDR